MKSRKNKIFPIVKNIILLLTFSIFCFTYAFIEPYLLQEKVTVFRDEDVPENFRGTKIIFASDFHLDEFSSPERIAETVRRINANHPDIVILGGDYVSDEEEYLIPCFKELSKIKAPLGVYGVTGNHDSAADYRQTVKQMRSAGIIPLENEGQWIEIDGQKIRLGGVKTSYGEISNAAPAILGTNAEDFVILASHNPDFAEELETDLVDLVVSGHTHGGQITLLGLWAPYIPSDYGHKYMKGIVKAPRTAVLVSNGVGTSLLPMRFFARPQIDIIILEKP